MSRPKYAIRLLRLAEEDLAEIVMYAAADRRSAAEDLATKIEKNISLLSRNPRLGRIPEDEQLVRQGYRYLIVDNYLIFYTFESHTIYVHRILHGARDYSLAASRSSTLHAWSNLWWHHFFFSSFLTLSAVMGNCIIRTPAESKMALAITAPIVMMAGSPPPCGFSFLASMMTVSIRGSREKRGIS